MRNVPSPALRGERDATMERIAGLLRERNAIDDQIAAVIHRPMTSGHLGEWIASRIFDIELESSAVAAGIIDGRFRSGSLQSRTVNIKWYLKREGMLDISESVQPDHYLVLAGPLATAASSWGEVRPWCIEAVFLFDGRRLRAEQIGRGVKLGVASSVTKQQWAAAQIYPGSSSLLAITPEQAKLLRLFHP